MARLPSWSVYRRTVEGFEHVGTVRCHFEGEAYKLAASLPDAPRYPVICHAHPDTAAVVIEFRALAAETERRSRRWAA